jgi:hypothetical protein
MSKNRFTIFGLGLICIISTGFSQINLNSIYCSAVKEGGSVSYSIDSLITETSVGNGIAKTTMTLVVTPDNYRNTYWDGKKYIPLSETPRDSIEINMSLYPGINFVAENLYLWVNGERQTGYIQDRTLANSQYTQIVGKRRDPALLQSWGNGNFNLRVFPASSNKSRKFAIQFQHTFKNDSSGLVTTPIPFQFDSSYYYTYGSEKKPLGYFSATYNALDNKNYEINIPGMTKGNLSKAKSFQITSKNLYSLKSGQLIAQPLSTGKEFAWTGIDKIDGKQNIGFSVALSESTVTIGPEPQTRIFVLDIRNTEWDWQKYYSDAGVTYTSYNNVKIQTWQRAQKYALMCLKQYVSKDRKFNLILQGENPEAVFKSPVSPTEENLFTAYKAIVAASPLKTLSTAKALKLACSQASDGIVVLISDLYPPCYYVSNDYTKISPAYQAHLAFTDSLKEIVKSSGTTLFTICDDYTLSSGATMNLMGLRYYTYYYSNTTSTIALPPLFRKYGITDIKVEGPLNVTDIVTSSTADYRYMYDGPIIASRAIDDWYYPYYPTKTILNVAAKTDKFANIKDFDFHIRGKIGGLNFTKKVTASAQFSNISQTDNVHWAFTYAEGSSVTPEQIKKTGIDYHIVTRNTALLALEPGMELWKDTVAQTQQSDAVAVKLGARTDTTVQINSNLIDSISLEDLYKGVVSVTKGSFAKKASDISLRLLRTGLEINFTSLPDCENINLELFDLKGRIVASHMITSRDLSGQTFLWKAGSGVQNLSKGFYTLSVKSKFFKKCVPVPIISR